MYVAARSAALSSGAFRPRHFVQIDPQHPAVLARDSHHPIFAEDPMTAFVTRRALQVLLVLATLIGTAGCETTAGVADEGEPVIVQEDSAPSGTPATPSEKNAEEGEVPLVVAQSEHPDEVSPGKELEEVVVKAHRDRHEVILGLVSEAKSILRDVELEYVFTGKGKKEVLRGRPVAFALWSETKKE
jgi:hypothetical protein